MRNEKNPIGLDFPNGTCAFGTYFACPYKCPFAHMIAVPVQADRGHITAPPLNQSLVPMEDIFQQHFL